MSNESCYLCTETNIQLRKICNCASSYICDECLILTEANINKDDNTQENRFNCHICRQKLNFDFLPSYKYYLALVINLLPKLFCSSIDIFIIYAIVKFTKTEYPSLFFTNQAMFIVLSIFQIIFVKNACLTILERIYKIPYTDFYTHNIFSFTFTILNMGLFGICFIDSNLQIQDLYFILVIGFILTLGFMIISLMVIFDRNAHIEKYLRIHNQYLKISVLYSYSPLVIADSN